MARLAAVAVCLALCVALQGAVAARQPVFGSKLQDIQEMLSGTAAASGFARVRSDAEVDKRGKGEEEEHRAYLAIKFTVPPQHDDDFIKEWKKLESETRREKSNIVYDLGKTATDNVFFYIYGEWETPRDAFEHFKSKGFQSFKNFAEDKDIEWEVYGLKNITSPDEERRGLDRRGKGKGGSEELAHVLVKYHVPPSHNKDFEDAWLDLAEDTWDEKDNLIYSLRKSMSSNYEYWAYGTWESFEAYHEHFHSKHLRDFREDAADLGVVYFLTPLEKFGKQEE